MKKGIGILFIILFILAIAGLVAGYFLLYSPMSNELSNLKASHEEQTKDLNAASSKASDYQAKYELASKKIDENEADLSKLTKKINELSEIVGDLDNEKRRLQQEKQDLETQKQQLESARTKLLSSIESSEEEKTKLQEELKKQQEELEKLKNINNELSDKLEEEIQKGDIKISRIGDILNLEVSNKILFETGSADVNKEGQEILKKVAEVLTTLEGKFIQIAGHTDNVPMTGGVTNWELASARAVNVLKLLQTEGVAPEILYAASFGEYQPKADNETPEGRALNRRIEIQILPENLIIGEKENTEEEIEESIEEETEEQESETEESIEGETEEVPQG